MLVGYGKSVRILQVLRLVLEIVDVDNFFLYKRHKMMQYVNTTMSYTILETNHKNRQDIYHRVTPWKPFQVQRFVPNLCFKTSFDRWNLRKTTRVRPIKHERD